MLVKGPIGVSCDTLQSHINIDQFPKMFSQKSPHSLLGQVMAVLKIKKKYQ